MDDKIYVKMNVLDAWVFKSTEIKRAMEFGIPVYYSLKELE